MDHLTIQPIPSVDTLDQRVWRFPTKTESQVTTLAAICHARQKQREPLSCDSVADIEDLCDDGSWPEDGEGTSTRAANLTDDNNIRSVKTSFLDRLAEILCSSKDASFVTCTSMILCQESVTIFAARNATWTESEKKLLEHIATTMERIASRGECTNPLANLFLPSSFCRRAFGKQCHTLIARKALNALCTQTETSCLYPPEHTEEVWW